MINELISLLIGIGGFVTAVITAVTSRKKTAAESQNIIASTYAELITSLREQVALNGGQITALMQKETEHLKLINHYQASERSLQNRVKELEKQIEKLNEKLKKYNETIN